MASASSRTCDYLGPSPVVVPGVMRRIAGASHLLGEAAVGDAQAGVRFLDLGTGSGASGLLAARAGAEVVPGDMNRGALGAAVEFRFSDLFARGPERVDLIIFDPRFRWLRPRGLIEAASSDENYGAETRFFRGPEPICAQGEGPDLLRRPRPPEEAGRGGGLPGGGGSPGRGYPGRPAGGLLRPAAHAILGPA